jgi:drug/metabolite transporter (DMT)-like permease
VFSSPVIHRFTGQAAASAWDNPLNEDIMPATILALLAALSFALGSVLQQKGTLETDAAEGDPRFLKEILRKRVWLVGGSLQIAGWVLQAAALDYGSLAVVQSLCALSLVFALPLGARITNQHIGQRSIIGALATLLGIIAFVAVGQPQGGTSQPAAIDWIISIVLIAGLVILLWQSAGRRRGALAAAMFATAAGLSYAFQAAVTKLFVSLIGSGVLTLLASWTTYALVLSALVGFAMQQSALKTGFLAPAMAASNATTLILSVLLGVIVFGESLSNGQGRLPPALLGLVLAVAGVVLLAFPDQERSPGQA